MSSPFTSFKFTPILGGGPAFTWSIDPAFKDVLPHIFSLEVAGSPDFHELLYEIPGGDVFTLEDQTNRKQDNSNSQYYRVKLETGEGNIYRSKGLTLVSNDYSRRKFSIAKEMTRKELLRMKYTGMDAFLLKRKIYGTPATGPTVDPVSGVPLTDQTAGFGNHYDIGYYDPVSFIISMEDKPTQIRAMSNDGLGVTEILHQEFRAAGFPLIETQDIIILKGNDNRFLVKSIDITVFPGTDIVIAQKLIGQLLPLTDPVNSIKF